MSLANVLINDFRNHMIEKKSLDNNQNEFEMGRVSLSSRISEFEAEVIKVKNENKMLSEKLKRVSGKVEASETFTNLEEGLKRLV